METQRIVRSALGPVNCPLLIASVGQNMQEQVNEMFSVLTEEETAQLAELLEKLSDHWMRIAPNKPSHHGR